IDDGVLVPVEHFGLEELVGAMRQSGEQEFRARVKFAFDKAAEKCSGGGPVEAMIVIKDSHPHLKKDPWKTC
ncbi:MAG: hypothetical protein LAO79_23045, partial [Acidobacteriia bacterium]|nr:hypothetical protein [Terriglobia bacterium]